MQEDARRPRRWWRAARVVGLVVVVCLVLLVAGLLVLHAPPVRAYALRYVSRLALEQGIALEAERLDYSLVTLRAALVGVRVSAGDSAVPFFEARRVDVAVPSRALRGEIAIDEVTVTDGRVRLLRDAAGRTNLPQGSAPDPAADPAPLPVERVLAPGLALEFRDEVNDVSVSVPALTLELSRRGGVALDAPARIARGGIDTTVTGLAGNLAFDGRDLRLDRLEIAASEGRLQVGGIVALRRREPSLDLSLDAELDVARLARWGIDEAEAPTGLLTVAGDVEGPLAAPVADVRLASDRVAWRDIVVSPAGARARVDRERLELSELRAGFAEGEATGRGAYGFETRAAEVELAWRDVSVPALVGLVAEVTPRPSGRTAGELRAAGVVGDAGSWTADTRLAIAGGRDSETFVSLPGEASLAIGGGQWALDARHRVGGVAPLTAALRGRLDTRDPPASSIEGVVRIPGVDVPALGQRVALAGFGSMPEGLVDGTIDVEARLGGLLEQPTVAFEAGSEALTLQGQPFADVRVSGTASRASIEVDTLSARQGRADGSESAGTVRGSGRYDIAQARYEGLVEVEYWGLVPTNALPLGGTASAAIQADEYGGATRVIVSVRLEHASWQERELGELTAQATTEDGRIANVALFAQDFSTRITGTVELEEPYRTSLEVMAELAQPEPVQRVLGLDPSVTLVASLRGTAEGNLRDWRSGTATLDVPVLALYRDVAGLMVAPAALRYEDGRVIVDRLEGQFGTGRPGDARTDVTATGALPVWRDTAPREGDGVRVTIGGDVGGVLETLSLAGVDGVPELRGSGPVVAVVGVAGSMLDPLVTAELELGPATVQVSPDLPPITGIRARARIEDDVIRLRDLEAAYEGARILASGTAPLAFATGSEAAPGSLARLQGRLFDVSPAMLEPLVEPDALEQVDGSVDVTLDITASSPDLAGVSGDLILERFSLEVADLPVRQVVPTRVVIEDGVARVAAWDWEGEGASLEVRGQVGLVDRQAALETDGHLDLRLLTPFARPAGITSAGRLEPRLSITGPLDQPSITGEVQLVEGAFRLADPTIVVDGVEAHAQFAGGEATLTSLRGTINGGSLAGTGRLSYAPDTRGTFNVDVAGMALNAPEGLRSEIDAALELTVAPEPGGQALGGELSGTVTVTRSSYREPLALVAGLLGSLGSATTGNAEAESESPVLDRLELDVRVVTDDDLVIRNNVARAELGADLRVIGTAASPALSGRAELREGGQLFLGRNIYTLNTGTIDFANPVAIEPDLDVVATTRAGGEEIEITLSGTPDTLTRTLRSPSAPELGQADLTSLLLTGRPMDELGSTQAAEVSAQLLADLSGGVLGSAGRALGFDTLRVGGVDTATTLRRDPADLASEVDPTTRLTFGKSLGADLDLTWSQSLRDPDAQTWILDYAPLRQLDLRLISDDEDLRTYAFRHDLTFGAPPSARTRGAVSSRTSARVSAVQVRGPAGFPESELRRQLRLGVGDRFDFIDWQEDRDRLARFYRQRGRLAARIGADRVESNGSVELSYDLDAGPETTVRVRGAELGGDVVSQIEDAWAESIFDGFLIDEAQQIVRRALARDGYLRPVVEVTMTGAGGARTLDVAIEAGARTRQTDVRVEGVEEPLRTEVADAARPLVADARGVMAPEAAAAELVSALRARGYANATARLGEPEFEGTTVTFPVIVDPGAAFHVGAIAFEGVSGLPQETLREDLRLSEGDTHVPAAIESARVAVQGRYRREGFTTATVAVRQQVRPEARAIDVAFEVNEGPRETIGEIAISGRQSIDEDVVLRTMDLEPGEPLRAADWLEARQRLFESGLFRRADVSLEPLTDQGTEGRTPTRVRVQLEEWPALRVRYGFQVAERLPETGVNGRDLTPGVSADVTRRTLFGRAITVGGAGQYERRERLGRVFVSTPTFAGLPLQSSFVLEGRHSEPETLTLVTDTRRLSWEQRVRRGSLALSYGLRFERNHTTGPGDFFTGPYDVTTRIGSVTTSGAWDTRDDAYATTRGTLLSSTLEYGAAALGSDHRFVYSLSQGYYFRSWRGVVLASAARFGVVRSFVDDSTLPGTEAGQDVSRLFFAGGSRTVRSVAENGLGPSGFEGMPLGGRALLVLNQEARVPLFGWVQGVVFLDAGNVFVTPRDIDLRDLTGAWGGGLRISTPFVLLRADYGRTLWGEPAGASRWIFGIGHTF